MTPRRDPVPRARRPWGWLGGILMLGILGGGVVAAAIILWENLDIQGLTRSPSASAAIVVPEPVPSPRGAQAPDAFSVLLYRSDATESYFPDASYYPEALDRWEDLVRQAGGDVRWIGSAEEVRAAEGTGLLVAPSALCLDAAEVDAFHAHTEEGGSLLLTWATGARDGDCEWQGWEVVRDLTGAEEVRQLDPRRAVYLTIPGGLPLSVGIEPASRVELRSDAHLALAGPGAQVYWSDWALNPAPAEQVDGVDSAARLRETSAGGRIAWFGFTGGEAVGPLDELRLERLFLNGILWAAGVPSAELHAWPDGARAALVLTQQVGWEFGNARHLAELARARNVPVTFFAISRLARDHPELASILFEAGEVGSQGADDAVLAGLPRSEQQTRLRRSMDEVEDWVGAPPRGLRPPEERFDAETLQAWRALGGSYVVGLNNGRTGSPEVFETPEGPIVLLPRVIKDDYNVIVQEREMLQADLVREFLEGTEKLHALGGIAVLSIHTQVAGSARRVAALNPVLDGVSGGGEWWTATAGELADWWLARRESEVVFRERTVNRFEVQVSAPIDRALVGARLDLVLPGEGDVWEPVVDGVPVGYVRTDRGIGVPLEPLESGGVQTLTFERILSEDGEGDTTD